MSNQKNGSASAVAETPKNGTPAKTETLSIRTVSDVMEALRETNSKVSFYNSFCSRFDAVKDFRNNLDGAALNLVISNEEGESIEFKNLSMINSFIDNAVNLGEEQRKKMEEEILSLKL